MGHSTVVVSDTEDILFRVALSKHMIADLLVGKQIILYLLLDMTAEEGGVVAASGHLLMKS